MEKKYIFRFLSFCVSCCPGAVPSDSFVAAVPVSYYVSEGGWSGRQTSFGGMDKFCKFVRFNSMCGQTRTSCQDRR